VTNKITRFQIRLQASRFQLQNLELNIDLRGSVITSSQ